MQEWPVHKRYSVSNEMMINFFFYVVFVFCCCCCCYGVSRNKSYPSFLGAPIPWVNQAMTCLSRDWLSWHIAMFTNGRVLLLGYWKQKKLVPTTYTSTTDYICEWSFAPKNAFVREERFELARVNSLHVCMSVPQTLKDCRLFFSLRLNKRACVCKCQSKDYNYYYVRD